MSNQKFETTVLGICLGMQLMCRHSEEGNAECLGIFDNRRSSFHHRNDIQTSSSHGMEYTDKCEKRFIQGIHQRRVCLFRTQFYVPLNEFTAAQTTYILPYSSALHKDNFYATQFHPEKSGTVGERIFGTF